jgi:hypothetical protein
MDNILKRTKIHETDERSRFENSSLGRHSQRRTRKDGADTKNHPPNGINNVGAAIGTWDA